MSEQYSWSRKPCVACAAAFDVRSIGPRPGIVHRVEYRETKYEAGRSHDEDARLTFELTGHVLQYACSMCSHFLHDA